MKRVSIFAILTLLCLSVPISAQIKISLESVTAFGNYMQMLKKDSAITSATGPGGGLEIRFHLNDMFSVSIAGNYSVINIDQDNPIDKWNWEYWIRYYRNWIIQLMGGDSLYLNGVLIPTRNISAATLTSGTLLGKDSIYKAEIVPRQYINLLPVILMVNVSYPAAEFLKLYASIGGGLYIFGRNLYLDEKWWKRFPSVNYTFQYGFKDYANEKTGTLLGVMGAIGGRIALTGSFAFSVAVEYHYILPTENRAGYYDFPLNHIINVRGGITFVY